MGNLPQRLNIIHKQYESSLPDRLALFAPNETFAKLGKVIVMRSDGSACCSNAQDFAGTVVWLSSFECKRTNESWLCELLGYAYLAQGELGTKFEQSALQYSPMACSTIHRSVSSHLWAQPDFGEGMQWVCRCESKEMFLSRGRWEEVKKKKKKKALSSAKPFGGGRGATNTG